MVYDNGDGSCIQGLIQGETYYVTVVNDSSVKLTNKPIVQDLNDLDWTGGTRSLQSQSGSIINIDGSSILDNVANSIGFSDEHGLHNGDSAVYHYSGAAGNSHLQDGTTYYVLVVNATAIKLLTDPLQSAFDDTFLAAQLDADALLAEQSALSGIISSAVSALDIGNKHTLRVALNPANAVTDTPAALAETIYLGYVHGFSDGQQVFYSNGGGDSIGGLATKMLTMSYVSVTQ